VRRLRSSSHLAQARLFGAFLALTSLDPGLDRTREAVPAEPVEGVFDKSIKTGVRKRSDAIETICALCSNDEISLRLRELGVNARGTKQVLAGRLLDSDPVFMRLRFADAPSSQRSALQCLKERDIDAAIESAIASGSVPTTVQGQRYRAETRTLLRRIFTSWPKALDNVPDQARGSLRVAAAMMALHGSPCDPEWLDANAPMSTRMKAPEIARTLLRIAEQDARKERWKATGITHAKIVFAEPVCAACSRLQGRIYNLRGLPLLPPSACMCEGGYSGHLIAYRKTRRTEAAGRAWSRSRESPATPVQALSALST